MKPFSNNHAKRRTARVAAIVWVFALASGLSNACLLEVSGAHTHATKHGHAEAAHEAAKSTEDAMADGNHHDDADSSKEACLKSCDDGSNAPVKLKASFGLLHEQAAAVFPLAIKFFRGEEFLIELRRRLDHRFACKASG